MTLAAGGRPRFPMNQRSAFSYLISTLRTAVFRSSLRSALMLRLGALSKTVRLVSDFRMDGNPPNKLMWFGFPNRFEIWDVSPTL